MKTTIDIDAYCYRGKTDFRMEKVSTKPDAKLYRDDADLQKQIAAFREEIDNQQQKLFAQNRQGILFVFQAMDAAGKDGTIRHVLSGINPAGVEVVDFKRPSEEELDHDYLWRCQKNMVQRGRIGIFNRSYYEEVLVCRVHPEIVQNYQRLPADATADMKELFKDRLKAMDHYESYLADNGITVVKFFLNVSKEVQKERFLERIREPKKNWKFNSGDIKERAHWDEYMTAYEKAINGTASKKSPWYVIPADDKGAMRLLVSAAICKELDKLDLKWPELAAEQKAQLAECEKTLLAEGGPKPEAKTDAKSAPKVAATAKTAAKTVAKAPAKKIAKKAAPKAKAKAKAKVKPKA